MSEMTYQKALAKAAALCSKSEKCVSDIIAKLKLWQVSGSDQERLIKYLISEKYIDEERFTRFFVRDKFRFNHWGKIKIRHHLIAKSIPERLIQEALEQEIDEAEYLDVAKKLLEARLKSIRFKTDFEKRGKLMQYLSGRGFEPDVIGRVLSDASEEV